MNEAIIFSITSPKKYTIGELEIQKQENQCVTLI